jgi:spore maturation protein CgeB
MRVLYVAMKYDYGQPERGLSFEHHNFYHSLLHMGHDILYFDFMTLMQEHGRAWMNNRLSEVARAEKPDVMFTVLFADEFDHPVIRELTDTAGICTVNWFCDDHWRFENYSRSWAPCFRWIVTTAHSAIGKYERIGHHNVIKSQWACNTFLYQRMDIPLAHDVSFVGQPYGHRPKVIERLRKAGIDVKAWGMGWDAGRASQEEMIRIFNQSRINLNLTTAYGSSTAQIPTSFPTPRNPIRRIIGHIPFMPTMQGHRKARVYGNDRVVAETGLVGEERERGEGRSEQIKGRNFEVPGCGGFLLSGEADNLHEYYTAGKEIVTFQDVDDLIEKVLYYLEHEGERTTIAQAGYDRTIQEHTYVHRFTDMFTRMGLPSYNTHGDAGRTVQIGRTEEVR